MNLSNIGGALSRVGTATLRTLEHGKLRYVDRHQW